MVGPQQACNHSNLIYEAHAGRFAYAEFFFGGVAFKPFGHLPTVLLGKGGEYLATFFVIRKLVV